MLFQLTAAFACGGLACDAGPAGPVVQTGEKIVFSIEPDGFVEAHVQVFYEGPPDAFAWVIPVPAEPEVFLSSGALFGALDPAFAPRFDLQRNTRGRCGPIRLGCANETSISFELGDEAIPPQSGVTVTGEGQAGPYDYVVLEGSSGAAVVDYLTEEGFDIVPELADKLAPYLSPGARFLAVRLDKDADTGDIAPLGFRYAGTEASIPIQLTAIASAPDLGVEVTVLGASRAIPTNYLHVELNPARFDWTGGGTNYYDVVARAVDQAGGQAFATDYAGPFDPVVGEQIWNTTLAAEVELLAASPSRDDFVTRFEGLRLPFGVALDGAFAGFLVGDAPAVQQWNIRSLLRAEVDLTALNAQLQDRLFGPMERAAKVFEQPYVTRMSTTLDPAEMTVDPLFALATGLPEVSATRTAVAEVDCRGSGQSTMLVLDDDRVYPQDLFDIQGPDALRIEQLVVDGPPILLVDNTAEAAANATALDGEVYGCSSRPVGAGLFLGLCVAGLMRRRVH